MMQSHRVPEDSRIQPRSRDRRQFLRTGAHLLGATAVGGGLLELAACESSRSVTGPLLPRPGVTPSCPNPVPPSGNDDTEAINCAISAVAASGGGVVQLLHDPATPYYYSGDINILPFLTLSGPVSGPRACLISRPGQVARINMNSFSTLLYVHLQGPGNTTAPVVPAVNSWHTERWTVENCRIENYSGAGINTGHNGFAPGIRYNEIVNNGDAGIQLGIGYHDAQIISNTVTGNGYNGIDCNGYINHFWGNECHNNGWANPSSSDRNGIFVGNLGGPVHGKRLVRNRCSGNDRAGIFVGGPATTLIINDNECWSNREVGILVEAMNGAVTVVDEVNGNYCHANGLLGFLQNQEPPGDRGDVIFSQFQYNRSRMNGWPCWSGLEFVPDSTNVCG